MSTNKKYARGFCAAAMLATTLFAGGCASEHYRRGMGITDEAGNSIAHNSALQVVDPWMKGVDDPSIASPAERIKPQPESGGDIVSDNETTN